VPGVFVVGTGDRLRREIPSAQATGVNLYWQERGRPPAVGRAGRHWEESGGSRNYCAGAWRRACSDRSAGPVARHAHAGIEIRRANAGARAFGKRSGISRFLAYHQRPALRRRSRSPAQSRRPIGASAEPRPVGGRCCSRRHRHAWLSGHRPRQRGQSDDPPIRKSIDSRARRAALEQRCHLKRGWLSRRRPPCCW